MSSGQSKVQARPSVCLLSFSAIADDPRVMRQAAALQEAGFEVSAVGFRATVAAEPSFPVGYVEPHQPTFAWRIRNFLRLAAARVLPGLAIPLARATAQGRAAIAATVKQRPDVVVANDWITLPVAHAVAARTGCKVIYDSHEFALMEQVGKLKWRLFYPPTIRAIEAKLIGRCAAVITVSAPIAEDMQEIYGLPVRPTVIRNLPPYIEIDRKAVSDGSRHQVLFHGRLAPGRGIEDLIDSVPAWDARFHLLIRGPGPADYIAQLKSRAEAVAKNRITFVPGIPVDQLAIAAAQADIGIFLMPADYGQARYALPNKLFEYIMAGLAVCMTDFPAMTEIIRRHDLGIVLPDSRPETVGAALNGLTTERLDKMRANARHAARDLNWDREKKLYLDIVQGVFGRSDTLQPGN